MAVVTTWDPGRMLAIARRDAGLNQQQVADHVAAALGTKVSRPLVSKWERNKAFPDINQWRELVRLFDARGVPTQDLTSLTWMTATSGIAA